MIRRAASAASAAALVAAALAGCSQTVHLDAQPDANDPACAEVSVRLPDTIGDLERRWTDAQATASWADEEGTVALFACGKEPPAPSTLQCVTFGGVDWVVDDADFPKLRMTTYGRSPAAEMYVDTKRLTGDEALEALSNAVQQLPKAGNGCTTAEDATPVPDDAQETSGGDGS